MIVNMLLFNKWDIFYDILSYCFIIFVFGSDFFQEVKFLIDVVKSIVEQKMDNMNGVYVEVFIQFKVFFFQFIIMLVFEFIQKVDQIVGQYQFRRMLLLS